MTNVNQLRSTHTTFSFESYSWQLLDSNSLKLSFVYKINPDITFDPSVTIHNITQEMIDKLGKETIDTYVFNIGMSEIFSYWKTTASPEILIKTGKLSPEAVKFWHKLLLKGMGEFFYANQIDFSEQDFVKFRVQANSEDHSETNSEAYPESQDGSSKVVSSENAGKVNNLASAPAARHSTKILIPIGGGKDSAVTLELLKAHFDVGTFIVSTPKSAQDVINASNIPQENQIKISRVLDPKIFELNEAGYLNGHVPISAYLAFLKYFYCRFIWI
jgi:UDP-N-acetyl-alpha-D-muramoyl-L-alanyl-L-glutamate epimerase